MNAPPPELLEPDVRALLERQDWPALRATLRQMPAPELADLLRNMDSAQRAVLFRLLPRPLSTAVFAELETPDQNALLTDLTDEETRQLLAAMAPDDRTELLEELPGEATQKLLNLLGAEDLREARWLLGYPEDSVGRLMTPKYVAVRPEWSVARALEQVRTHGAASETLDVIYVVDRNWKLLDELDLRRFLLARPEQTVEELMDYTFASLPAAADREEAVQVMRRYDLSVLPIVDSDGVLVGIVTVDDVLDVAEEEATEDFHRVAAVAPLRQSYLETGLLELFRKRVGWLLALVFMNIFSGAAIASFEDTIAQAVALVFFLPLLIDSGGNAGSQAATLMIRALAVGDVRLNDWTRLLLKEIGVASALGITMGFAVSSIGILRGGQAVGLAVALTMFCVVVVGSMIGTVLPFLLSRFRLDPATASAPLITSLADISGVILYFSIARWVLGL
jgi:magnesium transporter